MIGSGGRAVNRLGSDPSENAIRNRDRELGPIAKPPGPGAPQYGRRSTDFEAMGAPRGRRPWAQNQKLSLAPS
jgi:hypothetical protein